MTLSFSCERGEHDDCLRPTCSCYCGHKKRTERHARADELLARPATHAPAAPAELRPAKRTRPVRPATTARPEVERAREHVEQTRRPASRPDQRPDLDVDAIVTAYEVERVGLDTIAARMGTTSTAVRRRLVERGVTIRPKAHGGGPRAATFDVDEAARLYADGIGIKTLGARFGCSPGTVRARLVQHGVTIRAQGDRSKVLDDEQIVAWYRDRVPMREIARRLSVTENAVKRRLQIAGIDPTPGGHQVDEHVDWLTAAEAYRAGATIEGIARELSISPQTVRRRLEAHGVAIDSTRRAGPDGKPLRRPDLDAEQIRREYEAGGSLEGLAARHRSSTQTIANRVLAAGGTIRKPGRP